MKKLLLIFLFFLLSFSSYGQKIHFGDSTNIWTISAGVAIMHVPYTTYIFNAKYTGVTTVNSKQYRILTNYDPTTSTSSILIREDTLLNKVFILMNDTEHVYLDYNLKLGDTFFRVTPWYDSSYYAYEYYVSNFDSVIINGKWHRTWDVTPYPISYDPPAYQGYTIIEGIGCLNGPMYILYSAWTASETWALTCFSNNGSNPIVSPKVDGYFDNAASCTEGINQIAKQAGNIKIYPNPATTSLTIQSPNIINQITITNLLGQRVYAHEYNPSTSLQVDVSGLQSGVYFVKVNGADVRKFLKE